MPSIVNGRQLSGRADDASNDRVEGAKPTYWPSRTTIVRLQMKPVIV